GSIGSNARIPMMTQNSANGKRDQRATLRRSLSFVFCSSVPGISLHLRKLSLVCGYACYIIGLGLSLVVQSDLLRPALRRPHIRCMSAVLKSRQPQFPCNARNLHRVHNKPIETASGKLITDGFHEVVGRREPAEVGHSLKVPDDD